MHIHRDIHSLDIIYTCTYATYMYTYVRVYVDIYDSTHTYILVAVYGSA